MHTYIHIYLSTYITYTIYIYLMPAPCSLQEGWRNAIFMTALGEHRERYIFEGEHFSQFSYDLRHLSLCCSAGWRQSFTGGAVSNQDLPFEGPPEELRLVTSGMQGLWPGYPIHPDNQAFQYVLDEKEWNPFPFLDSKSEWVLVMVPDWQLSVQEPTFCLRAMNRLSSRGLSCQFWKDLSYWSFLSILDCVHFVCPSEHRLLTNYDLLGSAN